MNKDTDNHVSNTTVVPNQDRSDGWIEVRHKKTYLHVTQDKPPHVSINNLKEFPPLKNRYRTLHVEEDHSHEVNTSDQPSSHLSQQRFNSSFSSQDNLTLQTPQKQVKDHRVHKYAGNYLLLKRKARSQEGV